MTPEKSSPLNKTVGFVAGLLLALAAIGLVASSDLVSVGESPRPGVDFRRLPLLNGQQGMQSDGSAAVCIQQAGSYPAHLPSIVLRGSETYARDAYRVACPLVEKYLLAPGSARFAPFREAEVGAVDAGSRISIHSHVDAQSPTGALLRATFEIELSLTRPEWSVEQLTIKTDPGAGLILQPVRTASVP